MTKTIRNSILILVLVLWLSISKSEIVKIITSPTMSYPGLNIRDIQDIYTLNIRWDDMGNPITIVHMNKHSYEYDYFIENILYMSKRSYLNIIASKRARGTPIYVKYADTGYEVMDIIRNTPTSIGYVDSKIYINTGVKNEIKIININLSNY